ncbi:response regulator transcription factor [bacterium]|nr:response regulator transcription factor [bacterium]
MIKVMICDDQDITREGLKLILDTANDLSVIATASDGAQAIEMIPHTDPQVVLMDMKMPIMNGIEATREIKRLYPHIKVIVLTTYSDDEWVLDAIRSGADGFLLKDLPHEDLFRALRETVQGKTHVDPAVARKLFDQVANRTTAPDSQFAEKLSQRELEILTYLARGYTNPEIARAIHLSEGTVRNYISAIFAKLNVSDRTQAALLALRYGLVDITEI